MLKAYLLIALRSLVKNRLLTSINIIGLSVGIASCLLIIQYVAFELSYEKTYPNYKRIYRISTKTYDEKMQPASHTALSTPLFASSYKYFT